MFHELATSLSLQGIQLLCPYNCSCIAWNVLDSRAVQTCAGTPRQLHFCVMKYPIGTASDFHAVLTRAHRFISFHKKFHSAVQPVYQRSFPSVLKHVGSQIQYLSPSLVFKIKTRSGAQVCSFASALSFNEAFASNLNILRLVVKCLTRWCFSLSLSQPPMSFRDRLWLWNHCWEGWAWTMYRSALFVADHNTPDFILCVAAGVESQHTRFIFFSSCSCRRFISPACMGSGAAGVASQTRKRFLSDVTEKKPQQCALLSAPSRSSATKHFDWTLLSNPALQTVPFFLSKSKHKGITPKIARISGSTQEYPWSIARRRDHSYCLVRIVWKRGKKPCWKTHHKWTEQTKYVMPYWSNKVKIRKEVYIQLKK